MIKKTILVLCVLTCSVAHGQNDVEMADTFRSDGKIYVVIGTLVIVLASIVYYLIRTEIKLNKIEKHIKNTSEQ